MRRRAKGQRCGGEAETRVRESETGVQGAQERGCRMQSVRAGDKGQAEAESAGAETRVRESKTGQNSDVQPFAVMDSTKNLPFLPSCEPDDLKTPQYRLFGASDSMYMLAYGNISPKICKFVTV